MAEYGIFAAGCFWGVEQSFRRMPGVTGTLVGYTGGTVENPSYRDVCTDRTGHAEAVRVEWDTAQRSFEDLVRHFFAIHDPTQVNRQGPDVGRQYRSAIFVVTPEQDAVARAVRNEVEARIGRPIATTIEPAGSFWPAEDYHQRYFEKNGGACHI